MPNIDYAIYSSTIYTGLADNPWVQAIGIKDGRIAALGSNDDVKNLMGNAKSLDLSGRLVAPGLVDAHMHAASLGLTLLMVDLRNASSIEVCRQRIREAAANLKPGEWLIGRGWNQHQWSDGREPNKFDLDDIVPNNPAMMIRACGHAEWINSRALEICGIKSESPDPPGGQFVKYESGEPTGLLREARHVVKEHIPSPNLEDLKAAALAAQAEALEKGLTGLHTCESLAEWQAFSDLEREGKLKIRVHHLIQAENLEKADEMGLKPGSGSDRLWIGHVKLFADGALGPGTALLFEPYCDEQSNYGLPFLDIDELKKKVALAYKYGYSVAIHAIGDKAGSNALDAMAHGRKIYPGPRRDRVEHVQLHRPDDLDRYLAMDVTASVQPVFVPTDWDVAQRRWGEDRCLHAYAWKTILDRGIRMQFGSDTPVEPIAPIFGIQAAVLRQTTDLKPEGGWRPDQRLTIEEALSGFFRTAAWTSGKEDRLGSLAVGNFADLTVFEKDLTRTPPEEWSGVKAEMTIIGGETVYGG